MTTPGKGAQRSTEDCIRMASWNMKEIAESQKTLCAVLGTIATLLERIATILMSPKNDENGLPF
jgi:hypothetical protein